MAAPPWRRRPPEESRGSVDGDHVEHVDAVGDRPQIIEDSVFHGDDVPGIGGDVHDEPGVEDDLGGLFGQTTPARQVEQVKVGEENEENELEPPVAEDRQGQKPLLVPVEPPGAKAPCRHEVELELAYEILPLVTAEHIEVAHAAEGGRGGEDGPAQEGHPLADAFHGRSPGEIELLLDSDGP